MCYNSPIICQQGSTAIFFIQGYVADKPSSAVQRGHQINHRLSSWELRVGFKGTSVVLMRLLIVALLL